MNIRTKLIESLASSWKARIDLYLRQEGYVTYADRLADIKFVIADFYRGRRVEVAAMYLDTAEMVINPAMVDTDSFPGQTKKMMDQLSVLVRHELLHFLLVHGKRKIDHLSKTNPDWKKKFRGYSIGELSNLAADWDLSREGYDEHDKEVVRLMTRNGIVIGGLILSDDHPEWINLTYEEILDQLIEEKAKSINQIKNDLEKNTPKQPNQRNTPNFGNTNDNNTSIEDESEEQYDNNSETNTSSNDKSSTNLDSSEESEEEIKNSNDSQETEQDSDSDTNDPSESSSSKNSEDDFELDDKRDYANSWNEIIDRFDNDEISEAELKQLIADIESGKIINL